MVTVDDAMRAAWELVGEREPDIRLALMAAILSAQKPLADNAAQLGALRGWVRDGFPTRSPNEVYSHLARFGMVSEHQCLAILAVMGSYERGELAHLTQEPGLGEASEIERVKAWLAWRDEVARMYCLSWKTASFAALLMWPFTCPFVPVDQHVCGRFGLMALYHSGKLSRKSKPGYRIYRQVERRVYREWLDAGRPTPSVAIWHWYKWEAWRQETGASQVVSGCESHAGLCVC